MKCNRTVSPRPIFLFSPISHPRNRIYRIRTPQKVHPQFAWMACKNQSPSLKRRTRVVALHFATLHLAGQTHGSAPTAAVFSPRALLLAARVCGRWHFMTSGHATELRTSPNRPSFTTQYMAFRITKDGLLHRKRPPSGNSLTYKELQDYYFPLSSYSLTTSSRGNVISFNRLNHTREELLKWRVVWLLIM